MFLSELSMRGILQLKEGAELDALVCIAVMKWEVHRTVNAKLSITDRDGNTIIVEPKDLLWFRNLRNVPTYSRNLTLAWPAMERLVKKVKSVGLFHSADRLAETHGEECWCLKAEDDKTVVEVWGPNPGIVLCKGAILAFLGMKTNEPE